MGFHDLRGTGDTRLPPLGDALLKLKRILALLLGFALLLALANLLGLPYWILVVSRHVQMRTEMEAAEGYLERRWSQFELPGDHQPESHPENRRAGDMAVFAGLEFVWCPPVKPTAETVEGLDRRAKAGDQVTCTHGFWLARREVSKGEWFHVMGTTPWRERIYFPGASRWRCLGGRERDWRTRSEKGKRWTPSIRQYLWREPSAILGGAYNPDTPATHVTAEEILSFVEKLNGSGSGSFRLATESEWRYACRGGVPAEEDSPDSDSERRIKIGLEIRFAEPAGVVEENAWGVQGMEGSVSELVLSVNSTGFMVQETDRSASRSTGSGTGVAASATSWPALVLCGGSFRHNDLGRFCCCVDSGRIMPDFSGDYWGFRLVREAGQ